MDPETYFAIARHARKVYDSTLRDLCWAMWCVTDPDARKVIEECVENGAIKSAEDVQRVLEDYWKREQERSNTGADL